MESRRSYPVFIMFNGRIFNEVVISSHYKENHSKYMSDELILKIVQALNRENASFQSRSIYWKYFEIDRMHLGKAFRLILCISEYENYIGVVNCYRRKNHGER
jgi:hypothetical protein